MGYMITGIDARHPDHELEYLKWELTMRRASLDHREAALREAEYLHAGARDDVADARGKVAYLEQAIAALSTLNV